MRVLIVGGTGNIASSLVRQLVERGADDVTVFHRGRRGAPPPGVTSVLGERTDPDAFVAQMHALAPFDVVVDMIGYAPDDAHGVVRAFAGRCGQLIFCSTVDVYAKPAPLYPITETNCPYDRTTPWEYAAHKVRCEEILCEAADRGAFPLTRIRPVQTYGDLWVIDPLGFDTRRLLGRMRAGAPIVVPGDGLSLWGAVHRDDCAAAFVGAIGNPRAFGNAYHTSPDETFTLRGYLAIAAAAIGAPEPRFVGIPTELLARVVPSAFIAQVNFAFNNAFDNTAARRDLGFAYRTGWRDGVAAAWAAFVARGGVLRAPEPGDIEDRLAAAWRRHTDALAGEMASLQ